MFEQIMRLLGAGWDNAVAEAENIHSAIVSLLIFILVGVMIMWGFNIAGLKEVNFAFFFLGGIFLVAKFAQPRMIATGAVAGAVVGGLKDQDLSQSAVVGLQWLYKIALGMILGFWILAGLLATWSFKENPAAFFPVAAMAMLIAVAVEFFNMKGGVFIKWIIIGYAVGVILVSLFSTVPWSKYAPPTPSAQEARAQAERNAPEPPVALEVRLNLSTTEWSEPVYNEKGKCLQAHRTNPDLPPALAEVKDGGDWHTFKPGEGFAWIRFKAPVEGQNVVYEIKPDGTCS